MNRNTPEHLNRVTPAVVPLRPCDRVYYVEAIFMVPHRVMVAVPAGSVDTACQLMPEILNRGKVYGIPDFSERGAIEVVSITSEGPSDKGGASRTEPVPERYRHKRRIAGVTF